MNGTRRFGWLAIAVMLGCTSKTNDDAGTKRDPRAGARRTLDTLRGVPMLSTALADRVWPRSDGASWKVIDALQTTRLPSHANDAVRVTWTGHEGAWIDVAPEAMRAAPAVEIDGALVMSDAAPAMDLVYLARKGGVEELRVLWSAAAATSARYRLRVGPEIAGVTIAKGRIEARDSSGTVVIQSDRMWAVDANGVRRDLDVKLEDDTIVATLDARGLAYPLVIDPTWTTVAPMSTKRYWSFASNTDRGAAFLAGPKVLVAGGHDGSSVLASSEVFDVGLGTWTTVGPLGGPRIAPLTPLPSGKVLIAGGQTAASDCTYTKDAEIFDPAVGTGGAWTAVHAMTTNRDNASTATLLADGRVLVAGGGIACGSNTASAEIYNPTADTWTTIASMGSTRRCHVAALIPGGATGKVLVAGGTDSANTAEVYDPATNTWTPTGTMAASDWCYGAATTLPDGRVLLPGGYQAGVGPVETSQIYNPATNTWTPAASMSTKRASHASLAIAGKVLVIGGHDGTSTGYLATAELYDPISNTWSSAGTMSTGRHSPAAAVINATQVLVAGGVDVTSTALKSAEILTLTPAANGTACAVGGDCTSGVCVDGVCCNRACDGQCEACNVATSRGTCTTISGTPRGTRPACSGSGTCGGTCNGTVAATCTYPTTSCGAAACSDATHLVGASSCNGAGSCVAPAATDCAPGTCSAGACVAFDAGVTDTAVADTAIADTAVADTAVADTAVADTAVADTAVADTALPDTAVADTAVADTAVADTGVDAADTAVASDVADSIATDTTTAPDTAVGVDARSDTRDASTTADSGADAGDEDAATGGAPIPDAGCGCAVPARETGHGATAAVVALAALLLRRRRARQA